jgi:hypothetical protein
MPHQRELVRKAVAAALANKTVAKRRVTTTRTIPYRKSDCPAISVYTLTETVSEAENTAPRELTRALDVEIVGWVAEGPQMDDALDDLALQIETAIHADPTLAGTASDMVMEGTEAGVSKDGDSLLGLITLKYTATYRTLAPEADDSLPDFLTADALYDVGVPETGQEAEDRINVREGVTP